MTFNFYSDKRYGFVMKCRYKSIGHTFLWVQWKVRYDQASPGDLFRAKGASPGLKMVSPGRRTCELDRPELQNPNIQFPRGRTHPPIKQYSILWVRVKS